MPETSFVTDPLARFTASLSFEAIPGEVVARARMLILDCVGNIIRARAESESTPALLATIEEIGLGHGRARVFGDASTYGPAGAVLINATLAHSLDFDDTHAAAIVHAAAPIVPAALGAAGLNGASGADVVTAIVAGYEVALRIALALPPGGHYDRGFHPSATCGVFGAAAAASRVLRLNAAATASAFGIALSQSAGSLQFLANGAWTKRFQVGWAGMAGFFAAVLAKQGFKGAAEPLEGKHGFFHSYAPDPDPARAIQGLGSEWELMRTGVKPYPSCRWGHAGIDAALALRAKHGLKIEDIESVTLGLSRAAMLLIGSPAEKKANPGNIVDAQFSGPFVIASALATGTMAWGSYEGLDSLPIRALMQRITCVFDPEIEAEFPANMSGKLTVTTKADRYSHTVIIPLGEPENFLTEAQLRDKFYDLVRWTMDGGGPETLADRILQLDRLERASTLFQ